MAVPEITEFIYGDDGDGILKGVETTSGTWHFHKRSTIPWRSGGFSWENSKVPAPKGFFVPKRFFCRPNPHYPTNRYKMIFGHTDADTYGRNLTDDFIGTALYYFGYPDGFYDYPKGALTDAAILAVKDLKVFAFKMILNRYGEGEWQKIELRPEDEEFARTGLREHAPAPAPVYGPSSAALARLGVKRGGARKTKARRSVKKRRTVRRSRQ